MDGLKISTRLSILIGLMSVLLALVGAIGLWGMKGSNDGLKTVYEDRVVPIEQLATIERDQLEARLAIAHALAEPRADRSTEAAAAIEAGDARIGKLWAEYMATKLTDTETRLAKAYADARAEYRERGMKPAVAALRANDPQALRRLATEVLPALEAALAKNSNALMDLQVDVSRQEYQDARAHASSVNVVAIGAIVFGLLFGALFGLALVRGITRQLGAEPAEAVALAQGIARGDLAMPVRVRSGDSTSLMAALAAMRDSLQRVVASVRQNADSVATASTQIAQGNLDLSGRTEEQASALEQTAASMEELGSTVRLNADNAKQANQLAHGATEVAVKGGEVVGRVVDTMKGINDGSKKIADIITVIDGIAFQTNILALNAAVEAARAGEQGRGFAVVAAEVRNLAQRSAAAAKEIKTLITDSVGRVEQGTQLVDQAGATMHEVVDAIRRVADIMGEISAASREQSTGVAQVGEAVSQMDQATQQNAALVEESAAAAESLRTQAQALVQTVSVFRLSSDAAAARSPSAQPDSKPAAGQATTDTPTTVLAPGYAGPDRRGPERARNIVRPPFGAKAQPDKAVDVAPVPSTGTEGDWTTF